MFNRQGGNSYPSRMAYNLSHLSQSVLGSFFVYFTIFPTSK
ncbi:Uncharacterised protein [Vibrio cholerae]|nr:Uncharacterised protein [Vibrio cholerae]